MALKNWTDLIDGIDDVSSEPINSMAHAILELEEELASGGTSGENGATFTPNISNEGVLSWENDKKLPNPEPIQLIPRKGVEYFTDNDKEQIVNDVLVALPAAEGVGF